MSKKFDSSDKANIVVVGGGFAGVSAVKELAKKLDKSRYELILLTSKPYFVHILALARMSVVDTDNLDNTALIPYSKLQGFTHKVGTVTAIEETAPGQGGSVVLKDGERVPYAALVLATGSLWPGPMDLGDSDEEIRHSLKVWRGRYASARHVVVVGGGAVGIGELVLALGNISVSFPDPIPNRNCWRDQGCLSSKSPTSWNRGIIIISHATITA